MRTRSASANLQSLRAGWILFAGLKICRLVVTVSDTILRQSLNLYARNKPSSIACLYGAIHTLTTYIWSLYLWKDCVNIILDYGQAGYSAPSTLTLCTSFDLILRLRYESFLHHMAVLLRSYGLFSRPICDYHLGHCKFYY